MSYSTGMFNTRYSTHYLPPLNADLKVKRKDSWKHSVMDAFERIAVEQFQENLQFFDYYRMYEGKLAFQELSEVAPHLDDIQSLLDGVGIPSFLRHYDILGVIVNALVGQYLTFKDKYHVTDSGEVAKNEYLRHKDQEIQKLLKDVIDNAIKMGLAERGINPDSQGPFKSQEEQQAFMQQLEQAKQEFTPKDTVRATSSSFKTLGVKWGEATMDHDKIRFNMNRLEKEEFKHFCLSGRPFRHYRIGFDEYQPETWDSKAVFTSKEIEGNLAQDGEYVGRLHFPTPAEVVRKWGHKISAKEQDTLFGGRRKWGAHGEDGVASGSINEAMSSNFNKPTQVPFSGYHDYKFQLALQQDLDIPMGVQTLFNDDGTTTEQNRYLPQLRGDYHGRYSGYAQILKEDIKHRQDLCQTTEVYFRGYDKHGFLTYIDKDGFAVTEEVTEDILPGFLKDNDIKQTFKETYEEIVESFEPGTLKWIYRPYSYMGIKIESENLEKPIYIGPEKCKHQIKGDSNFDVKLPVAGWLGSPIAGKIEPYQAKFNLCMNQIYSLLEKELGMFFLMDTKLIPDEYAEWGDSEEAMMALRNIAKSVGIMPTTTSEDGNKPKSVHGNIATYNLSNSTQIRDRVELAEFARRKAFETIGIKAGMTDQPTKYETAEGIRQGQEASYAQIADIYEDFNLYVKGADELHLSVAQYCQSNRKDNSLYYTKSDGSIAFLEGNDPEFPLRRIGIVIAKSSTKRKEMEMFRGHLMNNNTLGSDTLEIASLIASDDMIEMIEIARVANERRQEQEAQRSQAERANIERAAELQEEAKAKDYAREEASKDKDRAVKIELGELNALGRAADKQSDQESFEVIQKAADESAFANEGVRHKMDMEQKKFRLQEQESTRRGSELAAKMKLDAKKLEEKIRERKSREHIAAINKN